MVKKQSVSSLDGHENQENQVNSQSSKTSKMELKDGNNICIEKIFCYELKNVSVVIDIFITLATKLFHLYSFCTWSAQVIVKPNIVF